MLKLEKIVNIHVKIDGYWTPLPASEIKINRQCRNTSWHSANCLRRRISPRAPKQLEQAQWVSGPQGRLVYHCCHKVAIIVPMPNSGPT